MDRIETSQVISNAVQINWMFLIDILGLTQQEIDFVYIYYIGGPLESHP